MNLLKRITPVAKDFFNSVRHYPVELALCILFFMPCVTEIEASYHNVGGYVLRQIIPVILMYIPALFAIAFALRCGFLSNAKPHWSKLCYYVTAILVFLPPSIFKFEEFGRSDWFGPIPLTGTYLLVVLLILAIRWQKDNRLFVADAINYSVALTGAAIFAGVLAMLYYALIGSIFYLFFDSYMSARYLVNRIFFQYIGLIILVLVFPLLFCYMTERGENKKGGELNKISDFIIGKMITPALISYMVILYLYAAKILFTWNLPKGGLSSMVIAFLVLAFVVNALQPFAKKERFEWFFKCLPYLSVVPLVMYWISTIRRISDYGFTQPRVYLLAFGILISLFIVFMLVRHFNRYLIMACISAIPIFFLMMVPPTSARKIAINSQSKLLEAFLSQYPIFDVKADSFVTANITKACLTDSAAVKQFYSSYHYLVDEKAIGWKVIPDEIYDVVYNSEYQHFQSTKFKFEETVDVSKYPYYMGCFGSGDFPIVDTCGITLIDSIDYSRISASVRTDMYDDNGTKKIKGTNSFMQKSDSILVVWDEINCDDTFKVETCYGIQLFAKKPYKVKREE